MVNYELPDLLKFSSVNIIENDVSPFEEYLSGQLAGLLTQRQDIHGRRIGTAKDAVKNRDYITKRQAALNLIGTLAQRPSPNSVKNGTVYITTDRYNVEYVAFNGHWYYLNGTQLVTLSPNTKPSLSVLYDVGYRIYATDFNQYFTWSGLAWVREGSNLYIEAFQVAPTENGWALCDGSAATASTASGGTQSITTKNLVGTGGSYLKYGSSVSGPNAAVAPTIPSTTGSGGAHTHTVDISGIDVDLPQHRHSDGTLEAATPINEDDSDWVPTLVGSGSTSTGTTDSVDLNHSHFISQGPIITSEDDGGSIDCPGDGSFPVSQSPHQHSFELSFSTEDALGSHDHSIPSLDVSVSVAGTSDSVWVHFHDVTGETGDYLHESDPIKIDFSGVDPLTSSSDGAHTHTIGAASANGEPRNIVFLPYIRL